MTKVATRLVRQSRLARFTLRHPLVYFTLGEQEAKDRGTPAGRTQSLGPQTLPVQFAALAYAALGPKPHPRMTTHELQELCPWLRRSCLSAPLPGYGARRECIGIASRRPAWHARSYRSQVRQRHPDAPAASQFGRLLHKRQFRLVITTGTSAKAAAIKAALNEHVWPDGLQLHLAVIPELLLLTARSHDDP